MTVPSSECLKPLVWKGVFMVLGLTAVVLSSFVSRIFVIFIRTEFTLVPWRQLLCTHSPGCGCREFHPRKSALFVVAFWAFDARWDFHSITAKVNKVTWLQPHWVLFSLAKRHTQPTFLPVLVLAKPFGVEDHWRIPLDVDCFIRFHPALHSAMVVEERQHQHRWMAEHPFLAKSQKFGP